MRETDLREIDHVDQHLVAGLVQPDVAVQLWTQSDN